MVIVRGRKRVTEQEEAFFAWWQKIEANKDQYNLRMAWDEGYRIGREGK